MLLGVILGFCVNTFAQSNTDSVAYQAERKKINNLLALRKQKFGEYDESLSKHTGIFGLQTKKDIRRSNDILMNIVNSDDDIFKELKILLEYRAFEQTRVQSQTVQVQQGTIGYMTTINRLRDQVDVLKADATREQKQAEQNHKWMIVLMILLAVLILLLFIRMMRRKA